MGHSLPVPPPGFDGLSAEDKIRYVQALWDHIAADADQVPLPDWQKRLLDERLADLKNDPDASVPWEEVRARLLSRLGQ